MPACATWWGTLYLYADGMNRNLREQQQRLERLAVVEERQRLARELHDSVNQSLYTDQRAVIQQSTFCPYARSDHDAGGAECLPIHVMRVLALSTLFARGLRVPAQPFVQRVE